MTLDDAGRLQEKWRLKYGNRVCLHTQLFVYLKSENASNAGYCVCLLCGEVYRDSRKSQIE